MMISVRVVLVVAVGVVLAEGCAGSRPSQEAAGTASLAQDWCLAKELGSQEGKHGVQGAFVKLNKQFLEAHARARGRACDSLAAGRLVVRYSFGTLEARWNGQIIHKAFILPDAYHPIKDISHAVFLTELLFADPSGAERSSRAKDAVQTMDAVLDEMSSTSATTALIPAELLPRQQRLLRLTRDAVDKFARGELTDAEERRYFGGVRDDLIENLRAISAEVVRGLHKEMEVVRSEATKRDPNAWNTLLVVVGVMHQARAREIGIQYFERLLQESVGEGASNERRLVIAENRTLGPDQYGLLSAHLVDQAAAQVIFSDPLRLQWDVLSDDGGALDSLLPPAQKPQVR